MTMRVTMLQSRYGAGGALLAAGSTYTVSDEFGAELVGWRFATDTDGVLSAPRKGRQPLYVDPATGVVSDQDGNASSVSGAGAGDLTSLTGAAVQLVNAAGLARYRAAKELAWLSPLFVNVIGDSIPYGWGSDGTTTTTNAVADINGYVAQLNQIMSARYGVARGGSFAGNDDRVVKAGNTAAGANTGIQGTSFSANSTGPGTFTTQFPTNTGYAILYYEDNGSNGITTGAWSYNDGSGAVAVPASGDPNVYKSVLVTGLSQAARTLTLTATSANPMYLAAKYYHSGRGVVFGRFGVPGITTRNALLKTGNAQQQSRMLKAIGAGGFAKLTVLAWGYNDWQQQIAQGTTPAVYQANLQQMIDQVVADGGCVLLLGMPPSSSPAPGGGAAYSEYANALQALASANQHCAYLPIADNLASFAAASAAGYLYDFVHPSQRGNAVMARLLAAVL